MHMGFQKASEKKYTPMLAGIARKTLVSGEHTLLTEFTLAQGADLPSHSHPQEQTGYLVSGRMMLTIGETEYDVRPGDAWVVPGGMPHGARVIKDSIAVEVFSPVREDYLP
jgi:quercetin dioxygenase-like cupin family protein